MMLLQIAVLPYGIANLVHAGAGRAESVAEDLGNVVD